MRRRLPLPQQPSYDYGPCSCGGTYEPRMVEVRLDEQDAVLTEVPQALCNECGGRIYKARVLDRVECLLSGGARIDGARGASG